MKKPRMIVASFTLPLPLLERAVKRAKQTYGDRQFAKWMRAAVVEKLNRR